MLTLFIDLSNKERAEIIIFSMFIITLVIASLGMVFYLILNKDKEDSEHNNTTYEKTNYKKNRFDSDWQSPIIDDCFVDAGGDTSTPE